MRTSKKLLLIGIALGLVLFVAGTVAWAASAIGLSYWPIFSGMVTLQIIGKMLFDRFVEFNYIKKSMDEYNKKPYKEYQVPLICQICGKTDNVAMDLSETEYRCTGCHRKNAIYVTFATAALGIETTNASH